MSKKILVVEDDELLNQLITRCLRGADYEVTGVRRWADADRYLEKQEPHLIITDVRLPDGDNLSRLPLLSEHQPVIVLTGFGSVRDAVESMKAGAFEYLVKPISPEELLIVVDRALDTASRNVRARRLAIAVRRRSPGGHPFRGARCARRVHGRSTHNVHPSCGRTPNTNLLFR